MNAPITISATMAVWLSPSTYSNRPQELLAALERGHSIEALNMLSFYGPSEKATFAECIRVGEADITVRLIPRDEQTRLAIKVLNDKLNQMRAAYHQRQQEILSEISKLTALTNEVEA